MQDGKKLDLDGAIWRFALDFYGAPGVSGACLRLQDESGIDVVSLIVILYADAMLGRRLHADELSLLQTVMKRWREETVLSLRSLRRRLKNPAPEFPPEGTESLRGLIKGAELRAEQIQLAMGESWLAQRPAQDGLPVGEALALLRGDGPRSQEDDFSVLIKRVIAAAASVADGQSSGS